MREQTDKTPNKEKSSAISPQSSTTAIQYLGGVMDEETRPLLKAYIESLGENEAALVVFRLGEGEDPRNLLESDIVKISGHEWNFISGGAKDDPMQKLVNALADDTNNLRVGNMMFVQGGLKVKASDSHRVCYGLITKSADAEIRTIKGIVHQQLNMGLNGDLLLHESDIIMSSMLKNGVFQQKGRDRPIRLTTYGAGGSASEDTNPGDLHTSDGVIDIRTHVDPRYTCNFLKNYCESWAAQNEDADLTKLAAFNQLFDKILRKFKEDPDYSGIRVVHHLAELSRLATAFTGIEGAKILEAMSPDDKQYIGEITFSTPNTGTRVVHRISFDKEGRPYKGNGGQQAVTRALQQFISAMAEMDEEAFKSRVQKKNEAEEGLDRLRDQVTRLVSLDDPDNAVVMVHLQTTIEDLEIEQARLEEKLLALAADSPQFEQAEMHLLRVHQAMHEAWQLYDEILAHFMQGSHTGLDAKLATLHETLSLHVITEFEQAIKEYEQLEREVIAAQELFTARKELNSEIGKARASYQGIFDQDNFSITAAGNIFFTEADKHAVGSFGAKEVEMENSLFVQIVHFAVANHLFIDEEHITKIAADPRLIEKEITQSLNDWAANYSMTVDDYVDAFMWAYEGQSFAKETFPQSGHWQGAERLYKEHPELRKRFYNFGDEEHPIIVNPFWKEIGTDLLKEISGGQAFNGSSLQLRAPAHPAPAELRDFQAREVAFEAEKKALQQKATHLLSHPPKSDLEMRAAVRELFSAYLNLMEPMQVKGPDQEVRYRCYARSIPVLKTGFVGQPISDWDQPLYKSTNTAVLANKSQEFVERARGRQIGGGKAMYPSDEAGFVIDASNGALFLVQMMKIAREEQDVDKALALGKAFLAYLTPKDLAEPNAMVAHIQSLLANDGQKLRGKYAAPVSQDKAEEPPPAKVSSVSLFHHRAPYPTILAGYIRLNKLTGPRVAEALERIREDHGPQVAKETGEKFIKWSISRGHHHNLRDIKAFIVEVNKDLKQESESANHPSVK